MNFIKTNWLKIILAAIFFVCGILALIPVFMLETFNFIGACQTIGLILFFVGLAIVFCLGMSKKTKDYGKFALTATGLFTLIFLLIGMMGLSKTDSQGAIGKSYAYFANVETTVEEGEGTLIAKQAELNAKKSELEAAKVQITSMAFLATGWNDVAAGFTTAGLFGTMVDDAFVSGINPATTKLEVIVANPAITSEHPAYANVVQLSGIKSQLVLAGLGGQTLQTAPYVMGGIISASTQSLPKLEEAIAQLQGVIDSNAVELAAGKKQVKDANAAAATILFLYVTLILGMGVAPVLIGVKRVMHKEEKE